MVVKRKNTWISIGMIYACSVIGVGFASGNEIIHFFTSYGMSGFYGILTASAIFSFVGFLLVNMCFRTGSYQLSDCYKATGGPFFASFAGLVGTLFSFCLFVLMLSAWTKILDEIHAIPVYLRYIIYVILFVFYCVFDIQNKPLAGWMRLLILSGTGTVLFTIVSGQLIHTFSYLVTGYRSWFLSAILYIGYNSFVSA
ncbi:MAG TPA: hypothetical protein DDZ89_12975, partial [Clostridiales bacterium]|nr:hypothetical protein [Clostridiales bacterium]